MKFQQIFQQAHQVQQAGTAVDWMTTCQQIAAAAEQETQALNQRVSELTEELAQLKAEEDS
jgi:hypothetical protein